MAVQDNIECTTYDYPAVVPAGIFRRYDIRGIAAEGGLTPSVTYAIGLAYGTQLLELGEASVVVGRDGRLTGPVLQQALVTGLREAGANVIDIGQVPTPVLYFATHHLQIPNGVMVTASHNPKPDNGCKMVLQDVSLTEEAIQAIYQRIVAQQVTVASQKGSYRQQSVELAYIDRIVADIKIDRPLKVVVDGGNGAASELAPKVLTMLGCEVIPLYCEVDGNFPNHHPDPAVPENLTELIATVKSSQADIGLAWDGDGDRLGVVTNTGEIIWPDRQLMLFVQHVLPKYPGATVVFDVKCSKCLAEVITASGGVPLMSCTGHSLIKTKMKQVDSPLSGEMSGHLFFKDRWYGFDDGLYVAVRLLELLAQQSLSASEVFAQLPNSVNTPELKLPLEESRKSAVIEQLIASPVFADAEHITIDGLRVEYEQGWGLVRASHTSPNLILRFEADTAEQLAWVQQQFRQALLAIDAELALPF